MFMEEDEFDSVMMRSAQQINESSAKQDTNDFEIEPVDDDIEAEAKPTPRRKSKFRVPPPEQPPPDMDEKENVDYWDDIDGPRRQAKFDRYGATASSMAAAHADGGHHGHPDTKPSRASVLAQQREREIRRRRESLKSPMMQRTAQEAPTMSPTSEFKDNYQYRERGTGFAGERPSPYAGRDAGAPPERFRGDKEFHGRGGYYEGSPYRGMGPAGPSPRGAPYGGGGGDRYAYDDERWGDPADRGYAGPRGGYGGMPPPGPSGYQRGRYEDDRGWGSRGSPYGERSPYGGEGHYARGGANGEVVDMREGFYPSSGDRGYGMQGPRGSHAGPGGYDQREQGPPPHDLPYDRYIADGRSTSSHPERGAGAARRERVPSFNHHGTPDGENGVGYSSRTVEQEARLKFDESSGKTDGPADADTRASSDGPASAGGTGSHDSIAAKNRPFDIKAVDLGDMKGFLLNPVPKAAGVVQCYIRRNRAGTNMLFPRYIVHLKDDANQTEIFLMSAKKRANNRTANYMVTTSAKETAKASDSYLGKVRGNFMGTEYSLYDSGANPRDLITEGAHRDSVPARRELGVVMYSSNSTGDTGPRKMEVCVPEVGDDNEMKEWRPFHHDEEMLAQAKLRNFRNMFNLINKPPVWNDQVEAYVLDFNGRVTMASVKNFQLVRPSDHDRIILQFGRVGDAEFTMDFQWPLSPYQAFAIALSCFDTKCGQN